MEIKDSTRHPLPKAVPLFLSNQNQETELSNSSSKSSSSSSNANGNSSASVTATAAASGVSKEEEKKRRAEDMKIGAAFSQPRLPVNSVNVIQIRKKANNASAPDVKQELNGKVNTGEKRNLMEENEKVENNENKKQKLDSKNE